MGEYAEGRTAYLMGREITANPYDPASAAEQCAHAQWRAGWMAEHQVTRGEAERAATHRRTP